MTPLTVNPTVALLVRDGKVVATATNVAPDLKVVVTDNREAYEAEACNKPFDTLRPVPAN